MAVTLMLYLFGKPGAELREGEAISAKNLRDLAQDLDARVHEAADIVEKLTAVGWVAEMTLYDVMLSHPAISGTAQAREALLTLGIDPEKVYIDEWAEEQMLEDDDEEEGGGLRPGDRLA